MATSQTPPTDAQQNQIPPEIRKWAQNRAMNVHGIERFDPSTETRGRGFKVRCGSAKLGALPDGYRFGRAYTDRDSRTVIQIRE